MKITALKSMGISVLVTLLVCAGSLPLLYAASLNLGAGEGNSGGTVTLPLTLAGGSGIAATSVDISYDPGVLANPRADIGEAGQAADKEVHANSPSPGLFRVGVIGMNVNEISDGVVATVTFDIVSAAPSGKTITVGNAPSASDTKGNALTIGGGNGAVKVK